MTSYLNPTYNISWTNRLSDAIRISQCKKSVAYICIATNKEDKNQLQEYRILIEIYDTINSYMHVLLIKLLVSEQLIIEM